MNDSPKDFTTPEKAMESAPAGGATPPPEQASATQQQGGAAQADPGPPPNMPPPQPAAPPASYHQRAAQVPENTWAMYIHLSALSGFVIPLGCILGPIILWTMRRDNSPLIDVPLPAPNSTKPRTATTRVRMTGTVLGETRFDRGFDRRFHATDDAYMIILDEQAIIHPHAMIFRATHARGIFFQKAQARYGLARVEQRRARPLDQVDIAARQRRDARQMLERVERTALGREHGAGIALKPHQRTARRHLVAILDLALDHHIGIERLEESLGQMDARHDDLLAAIHLGHEDRTRIDGRKAGDIAACAQILGKDATDEIAKIKLRKGVGARVDVGKRSRRNRGHVHSS